jgi:hypothetical protein
MKKEQFKFKLRESLGIVDFEKRKKWTETDLFGWWLDTQKENPNLSWERATGDLWQHVKGMCKDMIGNNAIY